MRTITRSAFRTDIEGYIDSVCATSEPLLVSCEGGKNVVVVSQEEWDSIQETFYINGSPEIMESIHRGEKDFAEGRYQKVSSVAELSMLVEGRLNEAQ